LARIHAANNALYRTRDFSMLVLENAADREMPGQVVAHPVDLRFTLPAAGYGHSAHERLVTQGIAQMESGNDGQAGETLLAAIKLDPADPDAWTTLATAQARLGRTDAARLSIHTAMNLDPGDLDIQKAALDIELSANPRLDLGGFDAAVRMRLSEEYSMRAGAALSRGRRAEAQKFANQSVRLWDDNADAYYVRAVTVSDRSLAGWQLEKAIERYRRSLDGPDAGRMSALLALALEERATARIAQAVTAERATQARTSAAQREAQAAAGAPDNSWMDQVAMLKQSVADLHEAGKLAPGDPFAITYEVQAELLAAELARDHRQPSGFGHILSLADQAVARFADVSLPHLMRALALLDTARDAEASAELDRAIELDPALVEALSVRAQLRARHAQCDLARRDLAQARAAEATAGQDAGAIDLPGCR
jgi:tetratricopeptide (TPR) repeat protein